jgi:tetratricopeptide (TPR) repeat protein
MKFRELSEEKRFRSAVTVLLAGLTILGSLIVILNNRSYVRGIEAGRDSRILGIRYLARFGRSLWESAAEKNLMVSWQELGGLMMQAEAYEKMSGGTDASLYRISRERLAKVRGLLADQGALTKPPYFDARTGAFDFARYYFDQVFIPAAELLERQEQRKREGGFWGAKSDAYTTGLAVMAVAVFLLTLSLVLSGRIRFVMAGAGLALVLAVAGAAAATTLRTWHGPAEESIKSLAKSAALVYRAQMVMDLAGDTASAAALAGGAKTELETVLIREPDYQTADFLLSRAEEIAGEALLLGGHGEDGRRSLTGAVSRIERIIRAGRDDGYIWWSRSYGELLLGRPDAALRSVDKALAALPDQGFALGTLRAAVLLASGRKDEAGAALETAVARTLEHPLASDPIAFRTITKNLEQWNEVAPVDGLAPMIRRLKEAAVCVSALQSARPKESKAEVVPPLFVAPVYDQRGEIVDRPACEVYPRFTARAHFLLEVRGMAKGQSIVSKVFWKRPGQAFWIEQLRMGKVQHWDGPDTARMMGFVANPMPEAGEVLESGAYRLEIYVDGALKAAVGFQVL